jgi:hypothetical protein
MASGMRNARQRALDDIDEALRLPSSPERYSAWLSRVTAEYVSWLGRLKP